VGGLFKTMRILVLGSEGQIGKPFCQMAEKAGHTIIRFDKKLHYGKYDLSYPINHLAPIIAGYEPDVVLFLAFEVGGSKFLQKNDKDFDYISENVKLMANTFSDLRFYKKPFLFASSQMANMHHTNYGFLKDLGERYTRSLDNGYICRFWNVYGYEDPQDPKSHVITDFIEMAATTGEIKMRTTGNEARQFLYTDDCSRVLLHWCENYKEYDRNEYIDITSFEWVTIRDVAEVISTSFKMKATIIPGTNSDTIQREIRNEPSRYLLNKGFWEPQISLKEGIWKLVCEREQRLLKKES
jgi:nucleoside-diphosphate-sugar epimerase